MTNSFPHRCIASRVLSRFRPRNIKQYFALLCFAVFAGSAVAQTPTPTPTILTYDDGDLFLGFRATDRTSDYLVNIKQPAQFVNAAPGSTFQVATGSLSADLAIAFGADWCTRIDPNTGRNAVLWAVVGGWQVGASGDPDNTLYSTNPVANPWPRRSGTAQSFTTSLIAAMGNTFAGNLSTPNNPMGLIQGATSSNSYASFQPDGVNSGGISFQTWNPWNEAVPAAASLFFNRIMPGSGPSAVLGTFVLDCSGGLGFTAPAATPTPSPTPTATATATVAPTPTPTPTPTVQVSGTVKNCANPALPPVANVTITFAGTSSGSTTTDGSGNYTLASLISGGTYTITPSKANVPQPPLSSQINTVDVIATQRHVLGTSLLSGCRLTAADVNVPPNGVNTVDVIATQAFFLARTSGFAQTGRYVFTPASRTYTGITNSQTAQNYDTVVLGDTAPVFVPRPGNPSQDAPEVPATVATIALPEVAIDQSKSNFVAAVKSSAIDAKNNLVGFQGDFTFDERVVTFQEPPVQNAGLTAGNWNVSGNVLPGAGPIRTLRVSAYSNDLTPLSGSGTLFELRMTRVSQAAQGTSLLWALPPDHFIFIDADLNTQRPGNATSGGVTTSRKRN